ncbi:uncharacterized protein LOC105701677 isoform X2 [Orussus abietinus]|uniref:uncharacterized protein LOC105701677 isoform X2 n=1 Tax=Orussus abietinus TaxID=222816 RepID=UPI000625E45D|nr:uncharacterized protein LOC105701677 isoform X2 [Orussus abietinus]
MSGMQAALLIRREKQRLRGGKVVNFRELPSNLATRLIPPLPRYPPRSYVYGCGGQGPGGGKAAWQGCNRPSSLPLSPGSPRGSRGEGYKTKQCEAHRRWMKRNRIRDASYCYGSSGDEEDDEEGSGLVDRRRGEVSAAVNTVLYAGLGTTALGLVVSFVGTGEKGFQSPELRLVGPCLLGAGLLCCLFRVLLCICLCRCKDRRSGASSSSSSSTRKAGKDRKPEVRPPVAPPPTASLLPSVRGLPPRAAAAAMTMTSAATAVPTRAHELLLSPAQLPE